MSHPINVTDYPEVSPGQIFRSVVGRPDGSTLLFTQEGMKLVMQTNEFKLGQLYIVTNDYHLIPPDELEEHHKNLQKCTMAKANEKARDVILNHIGDPKKFIKRHKKKGKNVNTLPFKRKLNLIVKESDDVIF